ncbi:uncharacterized protein LOC125204953 [Salvia hispanica]|uniref:uncharacterized protein LOC125204953 n=1 Tax=Salvia hispanica TaxID=49212 RepID=UPI0020091645|nr:uncharacterized protein LOC125204953 [Salvia hispanica]
MSEKGKEMIDHWSHKHPLTPVEIRERNYCYGCEELFGIGEQAYGCRTEGCGYTRLLHEECADIAREIRHPSHHPQHVLIQRHKHELGVCRICQRDIWSIGYKCSKCDFQMHLRCAQGGGMVDTTGNDDDDDEKRRSIIRHPSHSDHELKLLRRSCSFKCDACGTTRKDSSYTCTAYGCQYCIHEKCASLHERFKREDHHHYLSLSFRVPFEYLNFNYKCDVCNTFLLPNYWIYHCQICRFIVHVKCVFNKQPPIIEYIGKDIIHLPANEVAEELITPFVMRQTEGGGGTFIPPINIIPAATVDELVNVKYKFIHHQHQLTLVSSDDPSQDEEEEDEENYGVRSELICDGCITPISSSSYYYMSCSECKYNLHIACFHLPSQLSSRPLHQHDDHQLFLQSLDKRQPWIYQYCSVCEYKTNGLFYTCTKCRFKVDIKCACLPDTILHAAHPQHLLKYVTQSDLRTDINQRHLCCAADCGNDIDYYDCYRCCSSRSCDFTVHVRCALLPASFSSRRWDDLHPLLLTYDATLNRPGDFYCDQCETQMNPKSWMYHCRPCDLSFHPKCFPTTSGEFRNVQLGQEYDVNAEIHPHPLTFQLLTTNSRCDICGYNENENQGFYCALCKFFICLYSCGLIMIKDGNIEAVD